MYFSFLGCVFARSCVFGAVSNRAMAQLALHLLLSIRYIALILKYVCNLNFGYNQ